MKFYKTNKIVQSILILLREVFFNPHIYHSRKCHKLKIDTSCERFYYSIILSIFIRLTILH